MSERFTKRPLASAVAALLLVALGVAAGIWWARRADTAPAHGADSSATQPVAAGSDAGGGRRIL
jgi:hypothetical protein